MIAFRIGAFMRALLCLCAFRCEHSIVCTDLFNENISLKMDVCLYAPIQACACECISVRLSRFPFESREYKDYIFSLQMFAVSSPAKMSLDIIVCLSVLLSDLDR